MTRHDGAVLCVKWSPAGAPVDYLASAADDSIILIWKREAEGPAAGGAFEFDHGKLGLNPPVESYRPAHRLTDHTSDVAGLEWSPDGRCLASCGLDGTVIIWDVVAGFRPIARLEGHKGFVKGLAWDPLGVYLASQSDDHTMIIWRTHDWQCETVIKKPFDQANEETFFRRPSWSPDGNFVAAANSVNGRQPVVSLLARDTWKSEVAFVGHLLAVEVARFSPFLYQKDETPSYLCAAGSQDCNTSFWSDKSSKPLAVLTDLFEHAVMDIEWLSDGLSLLIAAYDGTIALVKLSSDLVGFPLQSAEHAKYLAALKKGEERKAALENLPTSIQQIQLRNEYEEIKAQVTSKMDIDTPPPAQEVVVHSEPVVNVLVPRKVEASPTKLLQKETTTKEGKRRIAPMLLQESQPRNVEVKQPASGIVLAAPPTIPPLKQPSVSKRASVQQGALSVEVVNNKANGSLPAETKVSFLESGSIIWEDHFESHVVLLEASANFVVAALLNRSIVIFSLTGRRLCPPLVLEASPVAFSLVDNKLLVVIESGQFKLWDLIEMRLVHSGQLGHLAQGKALASLKILPCGDFSVGFTDGRVFNFASRMGIFVQSNGGALKSLEYDYAKDERVLSGSHVDLLKEVIDQETKSSTQQSTIALESRLALAALHGDPAQFSASLAMYLRRLVSEGMRDRILETLIQLVRSQPVGGFPWLTSLDRFQLVSSLRPVLSGLSDADQLLEEVAAALQLH